MGIAKRHQQMTGSNYGRSPAWAWHYTLGKNIPAILAAAELRDTWHAAVGHRYGIPASIWFTTEEKVDPTSTPAITLQQSYKGDLHRFTEQTGGHWRIGVPADQLLTFSDLLERFAPSTTAGRWLRNLPHLGANRKRWRASIEPVPLIGCRVEQLLDSRWLLRPIESLSLDTSAQGYGDPTIKIGNADLTMICASSTITREAW